MCGASSFNGDLEDPAFRPGSLDHLVQMARLEQVPVEEDGPAAVLSLILGLVLHAPVEALDELFFSKRTIWVKIQVVLEADFCAVWYEALVEGFEKIQSRL